MQRGKLAYTLFIPYDYGTISFYPDPSHILPDAEIHEVKTHVFPQNTPLARGSILEIIFTPHTSFFHITLPTFTGDLLEWKITSSLPQNQGFWLPYTLRTSRNLLHKNILTPPFPLLLLPDLLPYLAQTPPSEAITLAYPPFIYTPKNVL